jgi:hypothetical protein
MSRNASGNYTLPAGNPVATGTTITVTWANPTMADVGNELTNSLDRGGRGAMTAPLKLTEGTAGAPAITFNSGLTSGLYRAGAGDIRVSVLTADTFRWINDTGTAAGAQQPAEVWDGAAWKSVVYAGGPSSLPVGTVDDSTLRWDAASSSYVEAAFAKVIDTGIALTVANSEIIADDTDGSLTVGAGQQGVAYGGNVVFFGNAHATKAGDFEMHTGATVVFSYDASANANKLGAPLDGQDNTLFKVNLLDYGEVTNAIGSTGGGTQDIDLQLGNVVTATVDTSANTFTFSNPTASDEGCGFTLILTNGGSQTVAWPVSVDWPAATAPTLTTAGVDILVFNTVDGGTTWYGNLVGLAYA